MKHFKRIIAAMLIVVLALGCMSGASAASVTNFNDVKSGSWYYDAVRWACREDITSGTSNTTFSPNRVCTRAQFLTFLWRDACCPQPSKDSKGNLTIPFADVNSSAYYAKAVAWACQKGICTGEYINGVRCFRPNDTISRAEVVTFLWRALGSRVDYETVKTYYDVPPSAYYSHAVFFLSDQKIISGTAEGYFSPMKSCTRAEAVTFLYRTVKQHLGGKDSLLGYIPFRAA